MIPNQNLFRVANEKTTFADAFAMADQVLYSGVACITDLMVKEGLINLDFADVRAIMRGMGKAMMGTGEASGEKRANRAAEAAIANPLLDDVSMKGARGLLISITGGSDLTLYELDEAATRIREEVDQDANIILGATFDESLDGIIRVSVVATGIEPALISAHSPNNPAIAETEQRIAEVAERLRAEARVRASAQQVPSIRTEAGRPGPGPGADVRRAAAEPGDASRAAGLPLRGPGADDPRRRRPGPVQPRAAAPFVPAPAPQPAESAPQLPGRPVRPAAPGRPRGRRRSPAPRGCRRSTSCRRSPRTRSWRAAPPRNPLRNPSAPRCCAGSRPSASAVVATKPEHAALGRPVAPQSQASQPADGAAPGSAGAPRSRACARYRSTARPRAASTPRAASRRSPG